MEDEKKLKKARNIFNKLKTDPASVVFAEELLDLKLLNKFKKPKYEVGKLLYKLVNIIDNKSFLIRIKLLLELIMLKKERLIVPPSIALIVLFNFSTLT